MLSELKEVSWLKVMVCHDGSQRAKVALERTVELLKANQPEIILLTVVEEPLDATSVEEDSFDKWRSKRDEDLKDAAQWVAGSGLNVDALLAVGDPRKMIIEAVGMKNPDLLVIARRGSGGTEKMVLGSVASYIVKHAQCPVMVL